MKTLRFFLILIIFPAFCFANEVSRDKAALVACNFYAERALMLKNPAYAEISVTSGIDVQDERGRNLYYIMSINKGGFVLVSATDNSIPVLGYSLVSIFDARFCNVRAWMKFYEKQLSIIVDLAGDQPAEIRKEWNRLSVNSPESLHDFRATASVEPLIVSTWNQDAFYNEQCPADGAGPDGHCYAGCVATAMGQLLYYYRFPAQGQGSYTYNHPDYGTISADFGASTYDWNGMPGHINTSNSPIAKLLFHQGVSVDMDYGPDGSGMWNHKAAYSLKTYFRYGPETQYYFRDSISLDWDSILVANLNQRKPMYYAGWEGVQSTSGHAFVCDGYQGTDYFHFNWGWGGSSDGYFYVNNLNPSGYNFNFAQEVIPLFPDTLLNTYPSYCNGTTELTSIRGSIEDGSGWYNYPSNSNCSWLIYPQDPQNDSITKIKLTFTKMNTEPGNDQVSVYDGETTSAPLLGTYSGNTLPGTILSSGDRLLVVFQSNDSDNRDGWHADFESVLPVYCVGTSTITDLSGDIGDGSGPKRYNNSSVCRWKIMPPGAGSVSLQFTSFDLPDTLDKLRIYDLGSMELLASLSGSELPDPIIANSGKMMLMFNSNRTINGQGWDGYFTSSMLGTAEEQFIENDFQVYPNPASTILTLRFYAEKNENMDLNLLSSDGQLIFNRQILAERGMNVITIDVDHLVASLYLLKLASNQKIMNKKILIY